MIMELPETKQVNEAGVLCGVMKAIGHPERLAIFRYLAEKKATATVKEIYQFLNLEQPVVSRQLGILKNNSVVIRETTKGNVFYRVNSSSPLIIGMIKCLFHTPVC